MWADAVSTAAAVADMATAKALLARSKVAGVLVELEQGGRLDVHVTPGLTYHPAGEAGAPESTS